MQFSIDLQQFHLKLHTTAATATATAGVNAIIGVNCTGVVASGSGGGVVKLVFPQSSISIDFFPLSQLKPPSE